MARWTGKQLPAATNGLTSAAYSKRLEFLNGIEVRDFGFASYLGLRIWQSVGGTVKMRPARAWAEKRA